MSYANHLIEKALEPTRNAIIARVKEYTLERVKLVYAKFEEKGWDLQKAFPISYSSYSFKADLEQEKFAKEFTKIPNGWETTHRINEAKPRLPYSDKQNDTKAQKKAESYAKELLDAYAYKLTVKVKKIQENVEIESVSYSGSSDPWSFSFLKVKLVNGKEFTLKTQIILNRSCLGTLFNQFPTRLAK